MCKFLLLLHADYTMKLVSSWCKKHRIRHNRIPPHRPIVFIVFLLFCPIVLYCLTSTLSFTPSRSHEIVHVCLEKRSDVSRGVETFEFLFFCN